MDATRGRASLARPLYRRLDVLRPDGDRRPFRRGLPSIATSRGRIRSSGAPRSSPTWLSENRTSPGSWAAHYDVWAFDGERASAIGESRYTNPDGSFKTLYYNHFALRFDGHGRCVEFIEYFMELPEAARRPLSRSPGTPDRGRRTDARSANEPVNTGPIL